MIQENKAIVAHAALATQGNTFGSRRGGYRGGYRERPKYVSPIPIVPEIAEWKSKFKLLRVWTLQALLDLEQRFVELGCPEIGVDTETTALSFIDAEIVGFSISFVLGEGHYIPVGHQVGENVPRDEALAILFRMMYQAKRVDFYHYRYDARILRKYGLDVFQIRHFDVMCLVWNADTNVKRPSLKRSSLNCLGIRQQTFENVIGAEKEDDVEEADKFVEYGNGVSKMGEGDSDGTGAIDAVFSIVEE
jgi:hypothetical protein